MGIIPLLFWLLVLFWNSWLHLSSLWGHGPVSEFTDSGKNPTRSRLSAKSVSASRTRRVKEAGAEQLTPQVPAARRAPWIVPTRSLVPEGGGHSATVFGGKQGPC